MTLENFNFKKFYMILWVFYFYSVYIVDMAGTSTRQFNLRSGKQEGLQIPVQIQLAEDTESLADLLKHQRGFTQQWST